MSLVIERLQMSYSTPNLKNNCTGGEATADDSAAVDDEYVMPCAEAMLAGTLALMTGHARCGCAQHRDMMGSKAAHNLAQLAQHPAMSEGFRAVAIKLHMQWVELIQAERSHQHQAAHAPTGAPMQAAADAAARTYLSKAEQSRALWHTTPEVIQ